MHNLNWDDLRFVLAVAATGSVSAAARKLAVNHATVLRRVAAFEESCGGPVFERSASGYRLRPERAPVIEAAKRAARQVETAHALMRGDGAMGPETLRLTSTDTLCQTVLAAAHASIARRVAPDRLVLLSSNAHLDMARLQADVAVRPALSLPDELSGRQVAVMRFAAYEAQDGAEDGWLGMTGPLARSTIAQVMAKDMDPAEARHSSDSFCVLRELAARGRGRAVLPRIIGDADARLRRIHTAYSAHEVPIWIACHRDLVGSDRIATLMEVLEQQFRLHGPALRGAD